MNTEWNYFTTDIPAFKQDSQIEGSYLTQGISFEMQIYIISQYNSELCSVHHFSSRNKALEI